MATYAVGDLQGCYDSFMCLLDVISFDARNDRLWLAGDLVNRGPKSLECLRYVSSLGEAATTVLGNHDLHLLAIAAGAQTIKRKDTFKDVLQAHDREEMLNWLRQQPFLITKNKKQQVLTHAGIPHIWTLSEAEGYAREVEQAIQGENTIDFFTHMYSSTPHNWSNNSAGLNRLRAITNYFTRMRFITEEGTLDFASKETPGQCPTGYKPWYYFHRQDTATLFFGHWAALNGNTGNRRFIGLDTGCVWGGTLTAINLDTMKKYRVPSQEIPTSTLLKG